MTVLAYGTLCEVLGSTKADALIAGEPVDDDALDSDEALLPRSAVLDDPAAFGGGQIG